MVDPRLAHPRTGTTEGSPWTSLEEPAICLERCFVGFERVPRGPTFRNAIRPFRPATDAFSSGFDLD